MTEVMDETVAAFWAAYCEASGATGEPADVFAFGDSPEQADELAALVATGTKRATAALVADHEAEDVPLPQAGTLEVVLRGDGTPVAVTRTTEVRVGPLGSVDEEFAWDEGEGDRSLDYWQREHARFFGGRCEALGIPFGDELPVVFVRFERVWPAQ